MVFVLSVSDAVVVCENGVDNVDIDWGRDEDRDEEESCYIFTFIFLLFDTKSVSLL